MYDEISLNPNMERIWGSILRNLRENGDTMLHTACSNLQDIFFTDDTIEITCKDDAVFKLLTKHRAKLGDNVNIHKYKPSSIMNKNEIIEKLEEIFGDRIKIKK